MVTQGGYTPQAGGYTPQADCQRDVRSSRPGGGSRRHCARSLPDPPAAQRIDRSQSLPSRAWRIDLPDGVDSVYVTCTVPSRDWRTEG